MIKKIKGLLKHILEDLHSIRSGQNQLWATQKLQSLFSENHFIPQTNWSLNPQAIIHCLNIISIKKPKAIIEFGSGALTLYIAQLIKIEGLEIQFFSVESDQGWKENIEKQLILRGLQNYVTIILAPILKADKDITFETQELWYDTKSIEQAINKINQFDLIIVDGPFGGCTPYARYSAYPFLKNKATKDTVWLLDDTEREQEKQIMKDWHKKNGGEKKDYKGYTVLTGNKKYDLMPFRI